VNNRLLKNKPVVVAIVVVLVVAVVIAVIAIAGGGSDDPTDASSTTLVQGAGGSSPSIAGSIVTIVGTVQRIDPSGDFLINDGHVDYAVAMSTAAEVTDLTGAKLSPDAIQVNSSVQVTGALTGSTITAHTVVVPSSPAPPPST